ncbi:MAG: hypothetical protein PHO83_10145 [Geobacteraceae bacterium]|nr:hypothetical protein [Geobacteraceae bacterium]
MQNVIKANKSMSETELAKIKEMNWEQYYRETASSEANGLSNCPNCNAINLVRDDQPETCCYNCGQKLTP